MKAQYAPTKISSLRALNDTILVYDMPFSERLSNGGIVLINDDMKSSGIRPRWAQVYAVGPTQLDVTPGKWILISHGRWSRGIKIDDGDGEKTIRKVDPLEVLLISDEPVNDTTMSDKV